MRIKIVDRHGNTAARRGQTMDFDAAEMTGALTPIDRATMLVHLLNHNSDGGPFHYVTYETDYEVISRLLAARNRRTSLRVTLEGSTLADRGVSNGRFARPTDFRFTLDGKLQGHSRALKGRWLIRGWRKAARFK